MGAEVELAPGLRELVAEGLSQVRHGNRKLPDLVGEVYGSPAVPEAGVPVKVKSYGAPHKPWTLTDAQVEAFTTTLRQVGATTVNGRRRLTEPERARLMEERRQLDELAKAVERAKKGIRQAVAIDHDLRVEDACADVPLDASGHYVAAGRVSAPGTGYDFSFEVGGGDVDVDLVFLAALRDAGSITSEQYGAMVKVMPSFDWEGFEASTAADPDLFVKVVQQAGVRRPKTVSMSIRSAER